MNKRVVWLAAVLIAALVVAGFFVLRSRPIQPARAEKPDLPAPVVRDVRPEPDIAVSIPVLQPPAPATSEVSIALPRPKKDIVPPPMIVPIQNGATIDFSIGSPEVRSGPDDTDALNKGLKEIDEAIKDVTFTSKPPPAKKDAEPAANPPKS
jgi:hypothetical protein